MNPIEKIRAEVEAVRKEHQPCSGLSDCIKGATPCRDRTYAEDKLKLAEALEAIIGSHAHNCTCLAHRVLAEVARD